MTPKATAYPTMKSAFASGLASSRPRVPLVRSRKVAMLVTTNGKTPRSAGPTRSKTIGVESGQDEVVPADHPRGRAMTAGGVIHHAMNLVGAGGRAPGVD